MITFTANIKEFKVSLDSVGDKVGRIVLKFWPDEDGDLVERLNAMQRPDTNVVVKIETEGK